MQCLKKTKIKLELIPDPDMFIFFKKGIKSRISYISNKYSKASYKYLKYYDTNKNQNILYT